MLTKMLVNLYFNHIRKNPFWKNVYVSKSIAIEQNLSLFKFPISKSGLIVGGKNVNFICNFLVSFFVVVFFVQTLKKTIPSHPLFTKEKENFKIAIGLV